MDLRSRRTARLEEITDDVDALFLPGGLAGTNN